MLGHGDNADGYGLGRMQICRGDKVDLFQCIMSKLMNNQRFAWRYPNGQTDALIF